MASGTTDGTVTTSGQVRFPVATAMVDGWSVVISRVGVEGRVWPPKTEISVRAYPPGHAPDFLPQSSKSHRFYIPIGIGKARLRAMGECVVMMRRTGLDLKKWPWSDKDELAKHVGMALSKLTPDELRHWNHEKGPRPK